MNSIKIETPESDAIIPVEIRHEVDEVIIEGQTEWYYNYLVYRFERNGSHCTARSYLEEAHKVSIFGPFSGQEPSVRVEAPDLFNDVVAYLKRRFPAIDALRENGYETIRELPDRGRVEE